MVATSSLQFTQQWLAALFLSSSLLSTLVAMRAAQYRQWPVWPYLVYTMAAVSLWCFSDAMFFVLASSDDIHWFWMVVGYCASIATAPLIFSVALCFAGHARRLSRPVLMLLWAPFVLGMGLAVTNAWHGLIWDPALSPLAFQSGPGHGFYFFLLLPLAYGLPLVAVFIFLHSCWRLRHIYRRQAIVLSLAVLLPMIASGIYFTDLNPIPGVDLAPAAFAATGVLGLYSMIRLHFMDLRPIYRDAIFEQMDDSAIMIDSAGHLLDLNPAAQHFLSITEKMIGHDALALLAQRFEGEALDLSQGAHQMVATCDQPPRYYDLRVSHAGDSGQARLVIWRDTTRLHAAVVAVYEQEIILAERRRAEAVFAADIQRAITHLKAQIRHATDQLDQGHWGLAAATLAEADSVTATTLLTEVHAMQMPVCQAEDLLGAIKRYVHNFAEANGLAMTFAVDKLLPTDSLAPGAQVHLVRILQEALENVVRHAAASHIEVSLMQTVQGQGQGLTLTVRDDGAGFDPDNSALRTAGAGLESMQRRALAVRGALAIDAAPGAGACVRLHLPIAPHTTALRGFKVVLAHGHPLVLNGLQALLAEHGIALVATCQDLATLLQALKVTAADLILLDIDLPGAASAAVVQQARRSRRDARLVLLLDSEQDPRLPAMLHQGVEGFLVNTSKTTTFLEALAQIAEGNFPLQAGVAAQVLLEFQRQARAEAPAALTARQQEILRLIGAGLTYAEIGVRLYLSERTVRYHTEQMRKQLGLDSRVELAEYARRHGLATRR
ncbi:MAG: response regulator [Caldilineaceae bacterium]|nr:response regulator [Caldilineaceae bacterium]